MRAPFDERLVDNPFYVLGVSADASRAEVEREGQKLLGQLALGLASAQRYHTPLGPQERTPERVRAALAKLRDPDSRLVACLWAHAPTDEDAPASEPPHDEFFRSAGLRR